MANLFKFDAKFRLGIPAIDREHRTLVDMLNHTHELMNEGRRDEARSYFLETLSDYVREHFSNEEVFLKKIGYPSLNNHKAVHANYRKSFHRLKEKISEGDDMAFLQALSDTFAWLMNHIGKTDRKYADYYFKR